MIARRSTESISRRMLEPREGAMAGSTAKYEVKQFVHCEVFGGRNNVFVRERAMKKWRRLWKVPLIDRFNPACETCSRNCHSNERKTPGSLLSRR
jgi:putative endonuclease